MSKAAETELSDLHGLVAQVLKTKLGETMTITNDDGSVQTVSVATPADIAVAVKFLKDNDITASVADDDNLADLRETLQANQNRRGKPRLASVTEI